MTIGARNLGEGASDQPLPKGCSLVTLTARGDERGNLIAIEALSDVPFPIERVYYIYDTDQEVTRGHHAHRKLRQLLVAVAGGCTIRVSDGRSEAKVRLEEPTQGLLIEGLIWREMSEFTADAVLLVLADARYDEGEYIRDYEAFQALVKDRA